MKNLEVPIQVAIHRMIFCASPRSLDVSNDETVTRPLSWPRYIDELGYVQLDVRGAELLFQILTEREEKASVAIGSNLPFSEWGQVVTDPRLVAAIVDRVTFNGHIIETGTESYRLRSTRARRSRTST